MARASALVAALGGAAGSLGIMLYVGRRNPSRILMLLFAIWVVAPFVALALANLASTIVWRGLATLTVLLTLASLAIYCGVAFGPPMPKPAFFFLVVPLASWILFAIAFTIQKRRTA